MEITLPLDKMSKREKIRIMEEIWNDLCKNEKDLPSPSWHENVLNEREERLKKGDEKFVDWEEAKNQIRDSIS